MSDERERMSWSIFGDATQVLAQTIHDDGFEPDMILAIARGGLFVAGALGYALGVKNIYTMNVEFYTGVDERMEVPMILPPIPDLSVLADAKVLIADDVADTGKTLKLVKEFVDTRVGETRSAVLYEKPWTVVNCEYVWKHTDRWIEFPWSDKPTITGKGTQDV
jgi:uncharacterized protein